MISPTRSGLVRVRRRKCGLAHANAFAVGGDRQGVTRWSGMGGGEHRVKGFRRRVESGKGIEID